MDINTKTEPQRESVWDYPRPPRLEDSARRVRVYFNGIVIADSRRAKRVLETSHPPNYYLPPEDVRTEYLHSSHHRSVCEWKGEARYYTLEVDGATSLNAAWTYPDPTSPFREIHGYISFYPARVDRCLLGEEEVRPEAGSFYGGWITHDIKVDR